MRDSSVIAELCYCVIVLLCFASRLLSLFTIKSFYSF